MYRAITYTALKQNADLTDEAALTELLKRTEIELVSAPEGQIVLVNGEDVTEEIRKDEVSNQVSIAAKHKGVREEMVKDSSSSEKKAVSSWTAVISVLMCCLMPK